MKLIPLTRGMFAKVDDEDFEKVSSVKWSAHLTRNRYCAARSVYRRGQNPKTEWLHLLILPARQGFDVDHISGDALDNQKENLRYAPRWGNSANRRKQRNPCTSVYKGVCWNRVAGKWRAEIRSRGKLHLIGYFEDETEAAKAYDRAAVKHFGEFARPNFL